MWTLMCTLSMPYAFWHTQSRQLAWSEGWWLPGIESDSSYELGELLQCLRL